MENYLRRCQPHWGIVEMVKWSADRFGGADVVLIEAKASGLDVINELRRLYTHAQWGMVPINPNTDKYSRAVRAGSVYAPARDWATMVKDEAATFPKGRFKDLTDCRVGFAPAGVIGAFGSLA
jgi:phage terminase large subunit-like protein